WFILRSENSTFFAFPFGANGDIPVPGDYDGDGRLDAAVFRAASTTWFVNRSTAGVYIAGFGLSTDLPVPNAYVR
ncbi:MAG: VCBS repeat-containing protein, partial [Blastocatellia bacterium]